MHSYLTLYCFTLTDLEAMTDCILCSLGKYCDAPGLTSPRGPCDPGYVCYRGAETSGPIDGVTGELCPAGGYCPLGVYTTNSDFCTLLLY